MSERETGFCRNGEMHYCPNCDNTFKAAPSPEPPRHIVELAVQVSGWSPCQSKRGVVIFSGEDVIAHGYNYKPRGFDCTQDATCKATCRREAVHAEQQALFSAGQKSEGADMLHVKTVDGVLVASGGPSCVECSKIARVAGIAGVWLFHDTEWRRYEMVEFHQLSLNARPQEPPAPRRALPDDFDWAVERVTRMCASAYVDASVYRQKLLKGFGYPNETFRAAQDARALSIVLEALCVGPAPQRGEPGEPGEQP
jgi:deoxycytidylate deaminase